MIGYPAGAQNRKFYSLSNFMHAVGNMAANISVDVGCLVGILLFHIGTYELQGYEGVLPYNNQGWC